MIAQFIVPICVITGAATAGLFFLVVAPRSAARLLFGLSAADSLTVFLVRYLGLLVGLIGTLTIYCAYHPAVRPPVLVAATVEKLFFSALVASGSVKRTRLLVVAAIADTCFALLYLGYLAGI